MAIVVVGTVLRLVQLGQQGLWLDEAAQVQTAKGISSYGIDSIAERDFVAPLSQILLWVLGETFGYGRIVVRAPSVVAGIVAIVLIAELGRRLYSPGVGLLAAALLAVSPFAIWYAQDGRPYSLLLCASLAIMLTYQLAVAEPIRIARWVALGIVTALGIWTHQYAVLAAAGCGVHLFITHRPRSMAVRRWVVVQVIAIATFIPWALLSWERHLGGVGGEKTNEALWLPYTIYSFFAGFSFGPSVRSMQEQGTMQALRGHQLEVALLALAAGVLVAAGIWALWHHGSRDANWFLASTIAVPALIAVLAPMVLDFMTFNVRYVIMAFPPILIGISTIVLDRRHRLVHVAAGALLLSLTAVSVTRWYVDDRYAKEPLELVGPYLAERAQAGDTVYASSWTIEDPINEFGYEGTVTPVKPEDLDQILQDIEASDETSERIWLVQSREWESDPDHLVQAALDETAELVSERRWPGLTIREYQRR